ncbi:MAG: beta-galactosidase, partial [Bacteroidales bacterium]|nr:beta-galactosidase [Bacteroidales bacterium]
MNPLNQFVEKGVSFFRRFWRPLVILVAIILVAVAVLVISKTKHSTNQSSPQTNITSSADANSSFGTMIAYSINDTAANTPSIFDAINQKGWTGFRENDSAYQSLLINLKKVIQDRTKLVKATGFSLDRELVPYFTWNLIEPQKGQFDWELTDIYVQAASNAGVKISAVIQPFAGWDQKNTQINKDALDFAYYDYKAGPPNDIAEYQNFLTKMVERYKDEVAVWEIGNEPENPGGGYKNNPEGYFNLVKITSETIKKADPEAKVTNGGAMEIVGKRESDSFKSYWTKFFALGGGQYLDYFNIHYNIGRSPDAKLDTIIFEKNLIAFNDLMDKNGGRKPLYLTEFGIYSGSPSSQPFDQPAQGQAFGDGGGKCGDNICDDFEKQNSNMCPQDCGGSIPSGDQKQPFEQPAGQNFELQEALNQNQGGQHGFLPEQQINFPKFDDTYFTISSDGENWQPGNLVVKEASVPDVIQLQKNVGNFKKGDLLIYFVDFSTVNKPANVETLGLIISTDGGKTWGQKTTVNIKNKPNKGAAVD